MEKERYTNYDQEFFVEKERNFSGSVGGLRFTPSKYQAIMDENVREICREELKKRDDEIKKEDGTQKVLFEEGKGEVNGLLNEGSVENKWWDFRENKKDYSGLGKRKNQDHIIKESKGGDGGAEGINVEDEQEGKIVLPSFKKMFSDVKYYQRNELLISRKTK